MVPELITRFETIKWLTIGSRLHQECIGFQASRLGFEVVNGCGSKKNVYDVVAAELHRNWLIDGSTELSDERV